MLKELTQISQQTLTIELGDAHGDAHGDVRPKTRASFSPTHVHNKSSTQIQEIL